MNAITWTCPRCKNINEDLRDVTNYPECCKCETVYEWVQIDKLQPCGHPLSAIVQADEGTAFCGSCADDSLRANIAAGVEA